ncbi:MAG TPA: TIGR02569 family protein [Thermomicrobiales bacterium]|nr:TIGR02569 family protein [Thermomicrobiales bacterium]
MTTFPRVSVRSAFGCTEMPVPLAGGQGEAFRCGDIVLKPCHDAEEGVWLARLHLDITPDGFRLPRPVRARSGEWIVNGWQAWTRIEGEHDTNRWSEVIATCRAFHRATAAIARPAFIDSRCSRFARADRIAWDEAPTDCVPQIRSTIEQLQSLLKPVHLPGQLIHGDFTENVLFADGVPPAMIDISPCWRPAAYAQAIVMVDALDWCGADASILELVTDIPEIDQLLARAEIFRIAILDGFHQQGADTLGVLSGHLRTVAMLTDRLG